MMPMFCSRLAQNPTGALCPDKTRVNIETASCFLLCVLEEQREWGQEEVNGQDAALTGEVFC